MASALECHYNHAFHSLSSFKIPHNPLYQPLNLSANSDHAFTILAIAVLSIMGAAFLLVGYYIFVTKCCFNWHHINLLRWFTIWRARRNEDSFIALSPSTMWNRGLDESVIHEIPTFQYRKGEGEEGSIYGCVVCLNEFQEQDMLRVLPNCSHSFHLDCIDTWFQSNANCPLCRTSISGNPRYPIDRIIAPSSSPQGSQPYTDSLMGSDEDYVVIELGGEDGGVMLPPRQQERDSSREVQRQLRSQSPKEMEQKHGKLKPRKRHNVSSMGDECIDVRGKDDQFSIQPMRRSFSLDSAVDRQLYTSVQTIIQQNTHHRVISTANEETSERARKAFFPIGRGRGSRNAVLPIEFDM